MAKATFFKAVFDHDKSEFSVHGPMSDDTYLIDRVAAAQKVGRKVNCTADHDAQTMAVAVAHAQAIQPKYKQVAAVV